MSYKNVFLKIIITQEYYFEYEYDSKIRQTGRQTSKINASMELWN